VTLQSKRTIQRGANIWYIFQQHSRECIIFYRINVHWYFSTGNRISFQQLCFCSTYTIRVFKYNRIVLWSLFTRYIVFEYKLRQFWTKTATIFLLHLFIPPPALEWFSGGSTKMRRATFIIISFYFYLFIKSDKGLFLSQLLPLVDRSRIHYKTSNYFNAVSLTIYYLNIRGQTCLNLRLP